MGWGILMVVVCGRDRPERKNLRLETYTGRGRTGWLAGS